MALQMDADAGRYAAEGYRAGGEVCAVTPTQRSKGKMTKRKPAWMVNGLRNLLRECRGIVEKNGKVYDNDFPSFVKYDNEHKDLLYRIDCALHGKDNVQ